MFEKLENVFMGALVIIACPFMCIYYCLKGVREGAIYMWEEFTGWLVFAWGVTKL